MIMDICRWYLRKIGWRKRALIKRQKTNIQCNMEIQLTKATLNIILQNTPQVNKILIKTRLSIPIIYVYILTCY